MGTGRVMACAWYARKARGCISNPLCLNQAEIAPPSCRRVSARFLHVLKANSPNRMAGFAPVAECCPEL